MDWKEQDRMSKPAIFVGIGKSYVTTKVHDHTLDAYRHDGEVKCEDDNCRRELILQGGVELVMRKWFCAPEPMSFSIGQTGQKTITGKPAFHFHESRPPNYTVECSSPFCNSFFQQEWDRYLILRRTGDPGRAVAAPTEKERPKTIAQIDEEEAELERRAREAARIESEVRRQNLARAWPLPR